MAQDLDAEQDLYDILHHCAFELYLAKAKSDWNEGLVDHDTFIKIARESYINNIKDCFGGVIKEFFDLATEDDPIPDKIDQIITCIIRGQPLPDKLAQYAASPDIWVGITFDYAGVESACQHGRIGFLRWMKWYYPDIITYNSSLYQIAVQYGQIEVFKYLNTIYSNYERYLFVYACMYGQLEMAQYLYDILRIDNHTLHDAFNNALTKGYVNIVQWLIPVLKQVGLYQYKPFPHCYTDWLLDAAGRHNYELVKYLLPLMTEFPPSVYIDNQTTLIFLEHILTNKNHIFPIKILKQICARLPQIIKSLPPNDNYDANQLFTVACQDNNLLAAQLLRKWVEQSPEIDKMLSRIDTRFTVFD